nr:hypothetical protein [Oceanococcus sp. HetDA_MAG_MS8]
MISLFQYGWLTGLALVVIAVDMVMCAWRHRRAGSSWALWLPHRVAGAALLLSVHLSLPTTYPTWGLILLSVAGLAHLADSWAQRSSAT